MNDHPLKSIIEYCAENFKNSKNCLAIIFSMSVSRLKHYKVFLKSGIEWETKRNIYSVSKTLIGLKRNETNDELLFPRLDFFSRDQREVSCLAKAVGLG